jgi:hypothetical protein
MRPRPCAFVLPRWRAEDLRSISGTDSCQSLHLGLVGRLLRLLQDTSLIALASSERCLNGRIAGLLSKCCLRAGR